MRLTKRDSTYFIKKDEYIYVPKEPLGLEIIAGTGTWIDIVQKLGQLEDIEDELGIDLITYVKLTTQTIVYLKNYKYDNGIKKAFVNMISKNDIQPTEYLIWLEDLDQNRYMFPLKRYGTNFALTKEELEK